MSDTNFVEHNREVERVWSTYQKGRPIRMPVIIGVNPRHILMDPVLNTRHITFEEYTKNPEVMMNVQLQFRDYAAHHIWCDNPMGLPEDGWDLYVDYQNVYEAGWLGAEILFNGSNSPISKTLLTDDKKNLLFEQGLPDPFGGLLKDGRDFYEHFCRKKQEGYTYQNRPIRSVGINWTSTDGPMTLACDIRGTENFALDLYEDPDYALQLLDYLTQATISRIKAWRRYLGKPEKLPGFAFADDSIVLLSVEDYKRFILPFHKKLIAELSTGEEPNVIHLCGDASRFFQLIRDELKVNQFDTGFPIDHGRMTQKLGPDVRLNGGPKVDLLLYGSPQQVETETKRIIDAVTPHTRSFVMREANNLSPRTPERNLKALYETVRRFGRYE